LATRAHVGSERRPRSAHCYLAQIHSFAVVAVGNKILPKNVARLAKVVVARADQGGHVKAEGGTDGV